jgi:hypothetical protein
MAPVTTVKWNHREEEGTTFKWLGLNAETKKVSAPSRRGDISLDIRFYRTLTRTALTGTYLARLAECPGPGLALMLPL